MPASHGGLLRLGVSDLPKFRSARPFDVGGMGVVLSYRPFDIEQQPILIQSARPFDILGSTQALSYRPFDIEGDLLVYSIRPFDIKEHTHTPVPGMNLPFTGPPANTTLATDVAAGATSVVVVSATNVHIGKMLNIGGEYRTVTAINGTTLTLGAPLGKAHLA